MLKQLYKFLHPGYQNVFLEYRVNPVPRYGHGKPAHTGLKQIIDQHRDSYRGRLLQLNTYKEVFMSIRDAKIETDPIRPVWNNGYLPGLDIMAIYTMVAEIKPKRFIEIGSGNSTKVAYKAIRDHGLQTEITSIDPAPRAEIDALANRVIREPFETADLSVLEELDRNDILFVDNSHRILPNSDAMVFFMEVLPKLKKGVIVHLHDIYLPFDYPQFMCDRFYSEQYGLAMVLLANPNRYKPLLPNYYISEDPELSRIVAPLWNHENLRNVERHGCSFWLCIES